MNAALLATLGFLGAGIAMIMDGRRAVAVAALAVAAGLAPTVAEVAGQAAVALLLGAGATAFVITPAAAWVGRRSGWANGLDPLVPVVSTGDKLFGPRSARVAAAAAAIPAASWVSFNVPLSSLAVTNGLLFAVAYAWLCGAVRSLLARSVEDLAVAAALVGLATAAAWILRGGSNSMIEAACVAAIAPAAGLTSGWLSGRHARSTAVGADGNP